jgi:hypothetical protein
MLLILILTVVSLIVVLCFLGFALKAVKGETVWQRMEENASGRGTSRPEMKDKWSGSSGASTQAGTPQKAPAGSAGRSRARLWEDTNYCWIVLCKNYWFHLRRNLFYRHRIPLGETDGVKSPPALSGPFVVRCDECGEEYLYTASDVLRHEEELPATFQAHPLFREDVSSERPVGRKTAAGA